MGLFCSCVELGVFSAAVCRVGGSFLLLCVGLGVFSAAVGIKILRNGVYTCVSIPVDRVCDAYSPWLQLSPRRKESGVLSLFTHPKPAVGHISIYTIKWVSGSLLLCVG